MRVEITNEGLKAMPPVTVTAVTWMHGLTLNDYVLIGTLVYIGLQAAYLIWKWAREARQRG